MTVETTITIIPPDANVAAIEASWVDVADEHLLRAGGPLADLVRRQGRVTRTISRDSRDHFARLVRAIVGQQISSKAAASIYGRVTALAGDPPRPETLMALPEEALRSCGLSASKLRSIRDLTERTLDGRLEVNRLEALPDGDIREQLIAVRGIGRWTVDMFLMFALGRPDVLPADDLGIQNAVQRLYDLETRPSPKVVQRLAAEQGWHPYATAACFHLWESLR